MRTIRYAFKFTGGPDLFDFSTVKSLLWIRLFRRDLFWSNWDGKRDDIARGEGNTE
jgi:hypothetical protein